MPGLEALIREFGPHHVSLTTDHMRRVGVGCVLLAGTPIHHAPRAKRSVMWLLEGTRLRPVAFDA